MKDKSNKLTLSIGDGANDVNMIRTANVGVGKSLSVCVSGRRDDSDDDSDDNHDGVLCRNNWTGGQAGVHGCGFLHWSVPTPRQAAVCSRTLDIRPARHHDSIQLLQEFGQLLTSQSHSLLHV